MYRRITSYIYGYDNGERISNCGYFRFDIREGQCKLSVNVKVPDKYTMGIAEIYILRKKDGILEGALLGKTGGTNGSICYKHLCTSDNIIEDISIDNMAGILIYNGESLKRVFAGSLKDDELDILSFKKEYEEENTVYKIDTECQEQWCMESQEEQAEIQEEDEVSFPHENVISDTGNRQENKEAKEDVYSDNHSNKPEADNEAIEDGDANIASMEIKESKDVWQELLFTKFPKVRVSFDGGDCEAVKMRPHDLVWFPRKYWRFSNNQCLLNGYYNYRYIMLVRGRGSREGSYYLAVPGKNITGDAAMARRQGFMEFIEGSGGLGYWCCKVGQ